VALTPFAIPLLVKELNEPLLAMMQYTAWAIRDGMKLYRDTGSTRVVALGRKNYLFVGNEDAGSNVASLYSLVATCEANSVTPPDYLSDVLLRVHDHQVAQIDDPLPHRWRSRQA
jgi:hypothetical protein